MKKLLGLFIILCSFVISTYGQDTVKIEFEDDHIILLDSKILPNEDQILLYNEINQIPFMKKLTFKDFTSKYNNLVDTVQRLSDDVEILFEDYYGTTNDFDIRIHNLEESVWRLQMPKRCRKDKYNTDLTFWEYTPIESYVGGAMIIGTFMLVNAYDANNVNFNDRHRKRDIVAGLSIASTITTYLIVRHIRLKLDKKCRLWY